MARPVLPVPSLAPPPPCASDPVEAPATLAADPCPERQPGGRRAGLGLLRSFLDERGQDYRRAMSSPVTAFDACSRLSPHLAWGTLSTREVARAARTARAEARARGARDGWVGSLDSFLARLHWRCHFMQKLEDAPEIEVRCLHPAHEGLRETDPARLAAWSAGHLPEGSVVISRKPRFVFLMSRLKSQMFPLSREPGEFFAEAERLGAHYLLLDGLDGLAGYYLVPVIRSRPGSFCPISGFGGGEGAGTQLLGVLGAGDGGGGGRGPAAARLATCPEGLVRSEARSTPDYSSSSIPLFSWTAS